MEWSIDTPVSVLNIMFIFKCFSFMLKKNTCKQWRDNIPQKEVAETLYPKRVNSYPVLEKSQVVHFSRCERKIAEKDFCP